LKSLGRKLFLLILPIFIFAKVEVFVDKTKIGYGESVKIDIVAEGRDVKFPEIDEIDGCKIQSRAKSESVNIIGSNVKKVVKYSLIIEPRKSIVIPSFEIEVDGKKQKTKPVKIEIVKKNNKNKDIEFEIKTDKKSAFVGEPIVVTLRLKIRKNLNIVDYRFLPPKFENFWVKRFDDKNTRNYLFDTPNYLVKELKYVVFPQKSGSLTIDPAIIKIATPDTNKDLFGVIISVPKWRTVASNEVKIDVKPLPENVDLIGNFSIKAYVDKRQIKPNEPVNLSVEIDGYGNIENLETIKLNIDGATVYSDKPKKIVDFVDKKLRVKFLQKFSIISDNNFTIPSIDIKYFDLKDKEVKELKTKPIKIEVLNSENVIKKEEVQILKSEKETQAPNTKDNLLYLFVGIFIGIVLSIVIFFITVFVKKKNRSFKIKIQKSDKELLNKLFPYISKNSEAQLFAKELYENIYEGKKHKIDKKRLKELLKELSISK